MKTAAAVAHAAHPGYQRIKERAWRRSSIESRAGRDIGDIPPVRDPERKLRALASFRCFCEDYFPGKFYLAWSADHLRVITHIETAVLRGGLFAYGMPRGFGKTTLSEIAVLWAVLIGAQSFVYLIGNSEEHAVRMIGDLKTELSGNDRLLEDFPDSLYAIRSLENESRRCIGQLHHGRPTHIGWTAEQIIFPFIPGSRSAGSLVRVAGITGNIRGALHTRPDGTSIRPSLVILDDPQTDQSAHSPSQSAQREQTIKGAVLGLAGPRARIAALMPCTVITRGDLADRFLSREIHPEWQGERTKMVYSFPTDEKLWERYGQLRHESLRNDGDGREATEFYAQHRAEMDAGAAVAWPQRHDSDELSALQHAMNLRLRDEAAFWAEYQNEPKRLSDEQADFVPATPEAIARRLNGLPRGLIPAGSHWLTAFVDVHGQGSLLYWMVVAWTESFSGSIVDYRTYPEQSRLYFTARDARPTLAQVTHASSTPGSVLAGLEALVPTLLERAWKREDGATMRIERALIDSGFESKLVYAFCRRSVHAAALLPSKGIGIQARHRPMDEYTQRRGERLGTHWKLEVSPQRDRYLLIDANWWKTFVHERLKAAPGDPGAVTLFGRLGQEDHRLLADHVSAETCVRTEGRGRMLLEWTQKVAKPDNHWLDCLVGCAVAGSMLGAALAGVGPAEKPKRARISLSELQRQRQTRGAA